LGIILQVNLGQTNRVDVEILKLLHARNVLKNLLAGGKDSRVQLNFVLDPRRYQDQLFADSSKRDSLTDLPWIE